MSNCKKQDPKRPDLDINELFRRIKFESKQNKRVFQDIEDLLNKSYQLMKKTPKKDNRNNRLANGNTFFNVAETPIVPQPTPAPTSLPPITQTQQTLIINILSTVRDIRSINRQIRDTYEALIGGAFLLRRRSRERTEAINDDQFDRADELERSIEDILLGISIFESQLANLRTQLEGLLDNLDIYIALLANSVL